MRKIVRVSYCCDICKIEYSSKVRAMKCGKKSVEPKKFHRGDKVANIFSLCCDSADRFSTFDKSQYYFVGKVIKIRGPLLFNERQYYLGGGGAIRARKYGHVFEYEVAFTCPHCKKKKTERFYAWELKPVSA